jgi:HTH-type transcriptional regulator / antitoxin HigA
MINKLKDERELLSKPGDTILETLEHIKMSQVELAERMGKTPSKINDIISGKEPVSVATALQLEKVLSIDVQFWLNREMLYREKLSRLDQEDALEECKTWLDLQPIKELKKCGYIRTERTGSAMVEECLQFYGVASPIQWESLYVNNLVSANFRKSQIHQATLGSMAAWLRIGEIEMRKLNIKAYDKEEFKKSLTEVRKLVREHPEDFALRLQELCLKAGVALVYTMCIPKAPISGAARWFGGNPLIQLTDRYKSNDHFWFTFYHEVGHIFLHGKKDVFMEDFDGYTSDLKKETEANEFANRWLLSQEFIAELPEKITEKEIRQIARKYETHPAIVLSRLQHQKLVPYSVGNTLKLKVILDDVISKSK